MVWLEDVLPHEWWDSWLNPTATYSPEELRAVQEKTRVPLSVEEVPLSHQMAAAVEADRERCEWQPAAAVLMPGKGFGALILLSFDSPYFLNIFQDQEEERHQDDV